MPTFEFENNAGHRIERHYDIGRAPRTITFDKLRYRRVPSVPMLVKVKDVAHVSDQLPLHWKHAPDHDETGRCRFRSQREIDETIVRAKHAGEFVKYNDGLDDYGKRGRKRPSNALEGLRRSQPDRNRGANGSRHGSPKTRRGLATRR